MPQDLCRRHIHMMQCENADNRDSCLNNCWSEVAHSALLTSFLQNPLLAFFTLRFAKRWHESMEQLLWGFSFFIYRFGRTVLQQPFIFVCRNTTFMMSNRRISVITTLWFLCCLIPLYQLMLTVCGFVVVPLFSFVTKLRYVQRYTRIHLFSTSQIFFFIFNLFKWNKTVYKAVCAPPQSHPLGNLM